MELDEFKQRVKENEIQQLPLQSAHELAGYMHRHAASTVKKIKRNIRFEILACLVFIIASALLYFVYAISYIRAFAIFSVVVCFFLATYLASLHKKISSYEETAPTVRSGLQQVIEIIEQFTRLYFQFTMITLPIIFIFGIITGFLGLHGKAIPANFNWQRSILFYSCWFIFWSAVMYFFSRWYIKKLYGNYLQQLKEQLRDIENG